MDYSDARAQIGANHSYVGDDYEIVVDTSTAIPFKGMQVDVDENHPRFQLVSESERLVVEIQTHVSLLDTSSLPSNYEVRKVSSGEIYTLIMPAKVVNPMTGRVSLLVESV